MSLLDTLRMGVRIADSATKSVQCEVTLERAGQPDFQGNISYGSPIALKAIVDWKRSQVRTASGELTVSRSSVMFLDIVALLTATNNEGIDDLDRITLPDGTTGPILDMSGFIDAGTTIPLATEVMLG